MPGDLPEAARWARRGLDIRLDVCGTDDITVVFDEAALVPILIHQGEYGPARALLDVVLPRLERQLGAAHYEVAVALTNLGALDAHQRRWEQAVAHRHRAAEVKRNALGPDSPELIRTLANLAFAADQAADPILARRSGAETLRIARASLSPSHPIRSSLEAGHEQWCRLRLEREPDRLLKPSSSHSV